MVSQLPLLVVAVLIATVSYFIYTMQQTEQLSSKLQVNKQPFMYIPGRKISPIPDHYGASWDLRTGAGGLQVFCQPTGGLGSKLFILAAAISLCAHKGLSLNGILLKRISKDPNSDSGPYDILQCAFDNVPIPNIFKDVFVNTNCLYLNYRTASSAIEEEAVLDGMFPGVLMFNKEDDKFVPVEISTYATTTVATNIISGKGWKDWRYFYNYERVVMDSLTMHPCLLDYCKVNYQFVYDPSYYVMGIFANFVNKDGHIITNRQPVNPVFCAKVIRSLYSENPKMKRIVVLVFTQDDSYAKEYYKQLFSVEGVHPIFVKENPYVILQLCQGLKFVIPDSGNFAWWCAYFCSYHGGTTFVPSGYNAQGIHPRWKVL